MEDTLITLKTAKLAKEKGMSYVADDYGVVPRPTQSLLQKWLREKHILYVIILPVMEGFVYAILNKEAILTIEEGDDIVMDYAEALDYSVYEEALEIGLLEALKLIKS